MNDYQPKFTFEITEEQQQRASKLLNVHGIRRAIFSIVLDDLLDLIEKHGQVIVGVILDGAAKPREIIPSIAKAERKAND
jgi:hypothetical protein